MKIAVIGASGQLGADIVSECRAADLEVVGVTHDQVEVSCWGSLRDAILRAAPEAIVNTAAMHNVELCEREPLRAFEVNAIGAGNLAKIAAECDARLLHVSTDYVFDGNKQTPYVENDLPAPLNVYGTTKLAGEAFVRTNTPKHFIVRTSALYGTHPCRAKSGNNFVELMLKLARERDELRVVNDEVVSPTGTAELAKQIVTIIQSERYGMYHATAEGSCTWYEFAQAIFELSGTCANLKPARPNEFPSKVPRPKYSVLENHALKRNGINTMPVWQDCLRNYLERKRLLQSVVAPSSR